jgi:hypothetical protein
MFYHSMMELYIELVGLHNNNEFFEQRQIGFRHKIKQVRNYKIERINEKTALLTLQKRSAQCVMCYLPTSLILDILPSKYVRTYKLLSFESVMISVILPSKWLQMSSFEFSTCY